MNTSVSTADTLVAGGLPFQHVLTATAVTGADATGPVVEYTEHVNTRRLRRGVYVVTVDGFITYVGKFTNTFAKRWLYTADKKIYHHKRRSIAESLNARQVVRVYAAAEQDLLQTMMIPTPELMRWITIEGIEGALVSELKPAWNASS